MTHGHQNITVNLRQDPIPVTVDLALEVPNILVVLLDDVGTDLLQQYVFRNSNHRGIPTGTIPSTTPGYANLPFFASEAATGIKFANFRTTPVCSPTRAQLLCGRYSFRHWIGTVVRDDNTGEQVEYGVNPKPQESYPNWMNPGGYSSIAVGKWHLGMPTTALDPTTTVEGGYDWAHPTEIGGFQKFRGVYRNVNNYPRPANPAPNTGDLYGYWYFTWYDSDDGVAEDVNSYATIYQRQELQRFLRFETQEPWIAYWALNAAHSPWGPRQNADPPTLPSGSMPPDSALNSDPVNFDENTIYGSGRASIEAIDTELQTLKDNLGQKVWDRTIRIYMSDNGTDEQLLVDGLNQGFSFGAQYDNLITNFPDQFKNSAYEGGVHAMLLVAGSSRWIANPGRVSWRLTDPPDVPETIRRLTRTDYKDAITDDRLLDGQDFVDVLSDAGEDPGNGILVFESDWTRDFSFNEYFKPNGDPENAADAHDGDIRDRFYAAVYDDPNSPNQQDRRVLFKLIRRRVDDGDGTSSNVDGLYRIEYVNPAPSNPNNQTARIGLDALELTNLINDPDYTDIVIDLRTRLQALLNSEP
jgi:arylsulfatase A-like enzyme